MTDPSHPPELTKGQRQLFNSLRERDHRDGSRLAAMYLGAVQVLTQSSNVERLSHAAQSMRELLEKLPRYYGNVPIKVPGVHASWHLNIIATEFQKAQAHSQCYDGTAKQWTGEIDSSLERLLMRVEEALVAHKQTSTKRDRNRQFLRQLDPLGQQLPAERENELLARWKEHDTFFQSVAHHQLYPTDAEFEQQMSDCTQLLVDQLRVATFTTMELLDQIIGEAE